MQEIDFVVTWVDGADPEWQREKNRYTPGAGEDGSDERYRDFGLFRYWFRGVEKFAPWVRSVYLVTCGHVPKWLDKDCPKLHLVRHEDYIPAEFLPTFNCNVIENHLHRIEGLSEQFVYFNDDMFLTKDVRPEDFFRGGVPCDMLALQPVVANPDNPVMSHLFLNNSLVLAKYFDKRETMRRLWRKYFHIGYPPMYFCYNLLELAFPRFTGLYTQHSPSPFLKETFREIWEKEGSALTAMSANRFRSETDLTLYLFREYQKLTGRFYAENVEKRFRYFPVSGETKRLVRTIERQTKKMICINDMTLTEQEVERAGAAIRSAFETILPEPSAFERRE